MNFKITYYEKKLYLFYAVCLQPVNFYWQI